MEIELKLVGAVQDATMIAVLVALSGNTKTVASAKAVAAPAAKVDQDEETETKAAVAPAKKAAPATAAKPAAKPAAAPAKKAAAPVVSDEDKIEALDAMDEADQLATVQAEVTKHSKKGKTADIKKLLAIYGSGKVSELDPATFGEFYGLVLRFSAGESADDIVESVAV